MLAAMIVPDYYYIGHFHCVKSVNLFGCILFCDSCAKTLIPVSLHSIHGKFQSFPFSNWVFSFTQMNWVKVIYHCLLSLGTTDLFIYDDFITMCPILPIFVDNLGRSLWWIPHWLPSKFEPYINETVLVKNYSFVRRHPHFCQFFWSCHCNTTKMMA